jgi:hypothetical protein
MNEMIIISVPGAQKLGFESQPEIVDYAPIRQASLKTRAEPDFAKDSPEPFPYSRMCQNWCAVPTWPNAMSAATAAAYVKCQNNNVTICAASKQPAPIDSAL